MVLFDQTPKTADDKVVLSFQDITQRLKTMTLPDVDLVVGIATGGTVPAALVAYQLDKPLTVLHLHYRDVNNTPEHPAPVLIAEGMLPSTPCHLLLVDDVSVSGQTLNAAKAHLQDYVITTLVMKGKPGAADYILFTDVPSCVRWPWKTE